MKRIEFSGTFDENNENLTSQMVKDIFFKRTLAEWEDSNSGSSISYEDSEISSQITIFAHSEYGLMLIFDDGNAKTQVLVENITNTKVVTFTESYTSCFRFQLVSKVTAWQAIEYFMQTGERNPNLQWKDYEVPEVEESQAA